eukprot:12224051-Karenia_brevis.AAC.1
MLQSHFAYRMADKIVCRSPNRFRQGLPDTKGAEHFTGVELTYEEKAYLAWTIVQIAFDKRVIFKEICSLCVSKHPLGSLKRWASTVTALRKSYVELLLSTWTLYSGFEGDQFDKVCLKDFPFILHAMQRMANQELLTDVKKYTAWKIVVREAQGDCEKYARSRMHAAWRQAYASELALQCYNEDM